MLIRRLKRHILRRILRGSRRLRGRNEIDIVERCQISLAQRAETVLPSAQALGIFGDLDDEVVKRSFSAYLFYRFGLHHLPEAILYAHGRIGDTRSQRVICALPFCLHAALEDHGLSVARFRSGLLWTGLVIAYWLIGVNAFLSQFLEGCRSRTFFPPSSTYISGIGSTNLPVEPIRTDRPSLDIVSWARRNILDAEGLIFHSTSIQSGFSGTRWSPSPFPAFSNRKEAISYIGSAVAIALIAAAAALSGRWYRAIFLHEMASAQRVRLAETKVLPGEYLFTSSNLYRRPLWSQYAEKKGVRVRILLYSTNSESFQRQDGSLPPCPEYINQDWSVFLAWNTQQKRFLERVMNGNPKIEIVGSTWFSDSGVDIPSIPHRSVAYFDVQPKREAWIEPRGFVPRYYTAEWSIAALSTLLELSKMLDFEVVYKQKRGGGPFDHPVFRSYLATITHEPKLRQVDPALAPQHLIKDVAAVVSMPWTSTAVIAREMNKPSCYLDISGTLHKGDPAAHGIPVLQSQIELHNWLKEAFRSNK